MTSTPRASASIIAAGIFAVLVGVAGMLCTLSALIVFSTARFAQTAPFPAALRPVLYGFWIFLLVFALFIAVNGVQVIRLRNWARISLLVIAGCLLFFGVMGIAVIFVTVYVAAPLDPRVSQGLLVSILAIIYGIPIAISLWWLILFTRRPVVAQFRAQAALEPQGPPSAISLLNNPECPLGVRIIGWFLGSFVIGLPFIPFFPSSVPAIYFGHLYLGPAAAGIYIFNFALISVSGIGLLLLKRWSYPLTIAVQLLASANAIYSTLIPSYEANLRAALEKMNVPDLPSNTEQIFRYSRYFSLIGLIVPVAILITLFVARRNFYEAAARASQVSIAPPPNQPM